MTKDKRPDTRIVNGGRRREWRGRLVNVPVSRASTILFDTVAELNAASPPRLGKGAYGLQGNETHWGLSDALTGIEPGAAGTALTSSGLAAITAALNAVLSAGDDLLMVDSCYGPTRRFCDSILSRQGVSVRYYDPLTTSDQLAAMLKPGTKAIFLESPGSQTFEVQDVRGICAMARDRKVATLIDNTWATPLFFPAIAKGVDISIMAISKYVGGHSDILIGSIATNEQWFGKVQETIWDLGHAVSPDDAYLAARGLRTLHLRMQRHQDSALAVARWLVERREVGTVLHPAFDSCPGHEYWKRDFSGSSSLFAFSLKDGTAKDTEKFVDALNEFGIGYSFGGFESLALPVRPKRTAGAKPPRALIRLHVGLEDVTDLIDDLDQAFAALTR